MWLTLFLGIMNFLFAVQEIRSSDPSIIMACLNMWVSGFCISGSVAIYRMKN